MSKPTQDEQRENFRKSLEYEMMPTTTPAPSQPAGAREWFMARRKMDAYISFDDMEEYAQFVARQQTAAKDAEIARRKREFQQLDNIIDEEGVARSCINPFEDLRNVCRALKAAERARDEWQRIAEQRGTYAAGLERDRDSLREALEEVLSRLPDEETIEALKPDKGYGYRPYPMEPTPRDSDIVRWRAALKAGKG